MRKEQGCMPLDSLRSLGALCLFHRWSEARSAGDHERKPNEVRLKSSGADDGVRTRDLRLGKATL